LLRAAAINNVFLSCVVTRRRSAGQLVATDIADDSLTLCDQADDLPIHVGQNVT
jgi:hypothetical protein